MIKSFSKLLYILGDSKVELIYLLVASVFASVLEAVGIGLIGPFLSLSMNPDLVKNISLLNWLYQKLGIQSNNQFQF
jgi:ATP-binding cassette, subfamily B, bacterial PglK